MRVPASQQLVSNSDTAFHNLDALFVEQALPVRHTFGYRACGPAWRLIAGAEFARERNATNYRRQKAVAPQLVPACSEAAPDLSGGRCDRRSKQNWP